MRPRKITANHFGHIHQSALSHAPTSTAGPFGQTTADSRASTASISCFAVVAAIFDVFISQLRLTYVLNK